MKPSMAKSINKSMPNSDASASVAAQRSTQIKCRRLIGNKLKQDAALPRRISPVLPIVVCCLLALLCGQSVERALCQSLPEDIQRELNQNLAEQARIQAMRARHQQQINQSRAAAAHQPKIPAASGQAATPANGQQQPHDPNNYSYQQVSPPIQYSYYQPYGDLAKPQQQQQQPEKPINIDLNNLNLDDLPNLPTPQAQTAANRADVGPANYQAGTPQRMTPHFTGVGGLPIMQPVAAANQSPDTFTPAGQAPMAPQAQQGPPLTEADFKDITGGENYGAPGGSDFGLGAAAGNQNQAPTGGGGAADNTDAQLREFGMPDGQMGAGEGTGGSRSSKQADPLQQMGLGDFGGFNPMAGAAKSGGRRRSGARQGGGSGGGGGGSEFDPFGGSSGLPFGPGELGGLGVGGGGGGGAAQGARRPAAASSRGGDFDFASQPSSRSQDGDQAAAAGGTSAPGSLQSLLGNSFPGLGGGNAGTMGLDRLAQGAGGDQSSDFPMMDGAGANGQQRQQTGDDGMFDMADMGDRSDNFPGADLGGMGGGGGGGDGGGDQQNDQDYNEAAAAEQQPKTVPYPDGGPQFVGTLWALSQPQSLTQTRYNALPDKGTYQDYPAYQSGGNDFGAVRGLVDSTPRARGPGPDRYGAPGPSQLAPEYQGRQVDYSQPPAMSATSAASSTVGTSGDSDNYAATSNDLDDEFF